MLIILGVCSFYTGFTKQLFDEDLYKYQSMGVNLPGEPDDIYKAYRKLFYGAERFEKEKEMNKRYDPKSIETKDFKGEAFIKIEKAGNRYYWLDGRREVPRVVNTWLEILGVFLFASGIMGFVLERKLFKP